MIQAGDYNARITIQTVSYSTDSFGTAVRNYANTYERWALYVPITGSEADDSGRDESFLLAEFRTIYDPTLFAAMSGDMRIIWDNETWEVKSWRRRRALDDMLIINARRGE